ncbi:cytochrome P450 [Panus rudis PR-1116 ss-1]|nr:cytochrome P450 [Panus rudis PR-1116 ss-1]
MGFLSVWHVIVAAAVVFAVRIARGYFAHSPLDNLPGPKRKSFLFGNITQIFGTRFAWDFHREIIYKYGPVSKIHGLLGQPSLLYVFDPKALYSIIVKDQYVYEETPIFLNFNRIVFGEGLLSSLGEQHRHQRKILNPVFHISHMRYMIPIFYRVTHKMREAIVRQVENGESEIDMLNWMTRAALELVGQGGLGHSFDPLDKDEINPFAEDIKALIPTVGPLFLFMRVLPFLTKIGTPSFQRRVLELFPNKRIQRIKEISDSLWETSTTILRDKKQALAEGDDAVSQQVGEGKDIISVLLRANMNASGEDKMPDNELLGHMSQLIFAAMETTSGALARLLHLLAQHQDVQDRLRQEIRTAKHEHNDQDIPYDTLVSLPYMEAVCREALRLYSPLASMNRQVREDIILPFSTPVRGEDGSTMTEVLVPKGTAVIVGLWASNINPAIWGEDSEVYKPERWLKPLPETVTEAHIPGVYSNLMTFLGGGRACIGFKFSQLEMKVVLPVLVDTFQFDLAKDKEIYWNHAGVQYPSVGRESYKSELPLRVSLAK